MSVLIIDNANPEDSYFNQPLIQAIQYIEPCITINYRDINYPNSIDGCHAIILSGVPLHYSFESIVGRDKKLTWIHDTHLPVLGICLGHQIIGNLFGTEVIEDKEAEDGVYPIHVIKSDPLLRGLEPSFTARILHRGSIALPKDFTLLGSSAKCQNHIMKHNTKTIYGCQFHPELSPDGRLLLKNFLALAATST